MPQQKRIPTITINIEGQSSVQVFTFYHQDGLPNILAMIIGNIVGSINDTSFIENELLAVLQNYPSSINVLINADGELIITGADAGNYSINANGELIYTY